ncbi:MAG: conjugative transposon protein TraN [Dysgonamonadaceae bacterium]|nr:conjugative transposon protein TraN [Dysgonamonadaceae bacterium]
MRKIMLLFALFISVTVNVIAQVRIEDGNIMSKMNIYDTVFVNNGTSYLIFNHDIFSYALGNETDFIAQVNENCLMIRNVSKHDKPSSIFVSYGDSTYVQYYYAILQYAPDSMQEFYDFRDSYNKNITSRAQRKEIQAIEQMEEQNYFLSELKTISQIIKEMPDEIVDLGIAEDGLSAHLRLIRTDNNYAYLKFTIVNRTAVDYEFDMVSFQYVQKYKTGLFRKKKIHYLDVFPVVVNAKTLVSAYKQEVMVYIIPIFGIRSNEELLITFRERAGGRNIAFTMHNKDIMKAKILEKRY